MNKARKRRLHRVTLKITLVLFVFLIILVSSVIMAACFWLATEHFDIPMERLGIFWILVLAFIFSTIMVGIFSGLFGKRTLNPIYELNRATKEIAKGNFDVRIKYERGPLEIRELVRSFNAMANDLSGIETMRSSFINDFSHELKTPVASICGFARQLKSGALSGEQRDEYISIIIQESERLSNLSSSILALSKLENQTLVTNKTDFYLDEQIRSAILLLEKDWSRKRLRLEIEMSEIVYNGDAELMSTIWINLLQNAIKFTNEGGYIIVKCFEQDGSVKVIVTDTGIGMDEEAQKHAFDKLYQGDSSRSSEGNGLGLALVKRVTELCGGTVDVKSRVGEGSVFTVTLPRG